jgi:conjugative transfer signal peptidase TraF
MNGRRFAFTVWGLAAAVAAAGLLADAAGLRINHTASLPMGLWRIETPDGAIGRGDIVSICPPDTAVFRAARARGYVPYGRCPGGYEPLQKPVAAIAGDIVMVTPAGLLVNGRAVPNSVALAADSADRPLPRHPAGSFTVAEGEFWLVSSFNAASFDSRYFGAVPASLVIGTARPVLTAGGKCPSQRLEADERNRYAVGRCRAGNISFESSRQDARSD